MFYVRAPDFDMSELENLFSAAVPNSDSRGSAEKSSGRSAGSRSEKVHLVNYYFILEAFIFVSLCAGISFMSLTIGLCFLSLL